MRRSLTFSTAAIVLLAAWGVRAQAQVQVDCDFPAGNIRVEKIEGDEVFLRQDLRDTQGDWFYWCFRVKNAAGRTLRFRFTGSNAIGVRGPAFSTDGGVTWSWLGRAAVQGKSFAYSFPADAPEVRFAFAIPYTQANLQAFLKPLENHPALKLQTLCQSRKGRPVELLRLGRLDGQPPHRLLLTCRHHACESLASYELEGLMAAILADDALGQWLRQNVEFLIVPFMDKDGVEEGDQGKNRRPHDHNRDYLDAPIHPEVAALKAMVPPWAAGKLRIALDLHCPHISGPDNEKLYFVGGPDQQIWARVQRLSEILQRLRTGPIVYSAKDNLPHGQSWNTLKDARSFGRWAATLEGIHIATTLELPYANAKGSTVTASSARSLGRDLAAALKEYLATMP